VHESRKNPATKLPNQAVRKIAGENAGAQEEHYFSRTFYLWYRLDLPQNNNYINHSVYEIFQPVSIQER
jgi:hypothetical protein